MFRMQMEWMDILVVNNATDGAQACSPFDAVRYPWKVINFFKWFNGYYYPFLHHHHDIEEKIVMPYFKRKGYDCPEEIMDDHVPLLKGMDDIKAAEVEYHKIAQDEDKVQKWTVTFRCLIQDHILLCMKHFDEEEQQIPKTLTNQMTKQEWEKVEFKIARSSSISTTKKILPPMLEAMHDWGGPEKVEAFLRTVPAPIRYLLKNSWRKEYMRKQRLLVESLGMEENPILEMPKGCFPSFR